MKRCYPINVNGELINDTASQPRIFKDAIEPCAQIKLSETPIFTNTSDILDQLNHHYTTQFHDLVYTQTLPSINEIQKAINEVAVREWEIEIVESSKI